MDDQREEGGTRVFLSPEQAAEFWREIQAVIDRYPTIIDGMDEALEGETDGWGNRYDPTTPKFVQGIAICLSVGNMDHWDSMVVLDPIEQASYMTQGMIAAAHQSFNNY